MHPVRIGFSSRRQRTAERNFEVKCVFQVQRKAVATVSIPIESSLMQLKYPDSDTTLKRGDVFFCWMSVGPPLMFSLLIVHLSFEDDIGLVT